MNKIAVIGEKSCIMGFSAVGFEIFPMSDAYSASACLKKLAFESYAIIFITEDLGEKLKDEIDKYSESLTPAIILIPGSSDKSEIAMKNIQSMIKRAVGSDLAP
ncbi:MAG: V-type ATP synthase subunit F [Clostridia bacterium]|nr:V-type ATP synthase subunit F [Clostridia bacterium]